MSEDNSEKKKDLTSIIDLPQADPPKTDDGQGAEFNSNPPTETIETFESLDQIGMVDHPTTPTVELPPMEGASVIQSFAEPIEPSPFIETPVETPIDAPVETIETPGEAPIEAPVFVQPDPPTVEDIREYSEQVQESSHEYARAVPFRLLISGEFDPFARDKLLLFINDNPIGISSSDLDFQINAGRVLVPQISEYAGIRLIQELRETGLQFKLTAVEPDADEVIPETETRRFQWSADVEAKPPFSEVSVLPVESIDSHIHLIMDSLQTVQLIRAEVIELEKSEVFQELLNRMLIQLKIKAARRGAIALTHLKHTVTPLPVASQYEVQMTASLVKGL